MVYLRGCDVLVKRKVCWADFAVCSGEFVCGSSSTTRCWMWEHSVDMKEEEGSCIERARESDYIHNQMSNQVTNRVTRDVNKQAKPSLSR